MADSKHELDQPGLELQDILVVPFKHKWKILFFALIGLAVAAAIYVLYPPVYESQAKLLVRYVIDRSAVDAIDSSTSGNSASSDSLINAEVEILTSWDLAVQVAEAVGVDRLVPNVPGGATKTAAGGAVQKGLKALASRGSNVILVSYRNRDPELARGVLEELVRRYFNKHLEVHRSAGAFTFVTEQTDQVRGRLMQSEGELLALKKSTGILSLADSTAAFNNEVARTQGQLHEAEAELEEQRARVNELEKLSPNGATSKEDAAASPSANANAAPANATEGGAATAAAQGASTPPLSPTTNSPAPDIDTVQNYQTLVSRLATLRKNAVELLGKYTPQNTLVKNNQSQIDELETERRELERKFPSLVATTPTSQPGTDLATERGRLAGLEARTKWLKNRLQIVQEGVRQFADTASKMAQLERQKGVEEKNYTYFGERLEKARVDEALDPKQMPNISAVQAPSPAARVTKERDKLTLGFAGGGLAFGLALALFLELIVDRSVKRPLELETKLRIPLLLSIPYIGRKARNRNRRLLQNGSGNGNGKSLALKNKTNGHPNTAPWEGEHFVRTYSEAIRDRLDLFFRLNDLRHKPKLIGVAGFAHGAGSSTLAGGLAAALSELGDGKVLLVDMNAASAQVHPFFEGRPASSLHAALQPANPIASAAENLYLATAAGNDGPAQLGLKKFYDLMPTLKASDFDYIVFDMPPLEQTSPTLSMARFMDKVLLIIEAEKSNRDAVKRAYQKLVASRANVSGILNKTRTYGPAALAAEV